MDTRNTRTPAVGLQAGFPFDYAAHLDGDRRVGRLPATAPGTPVAVVGTGRSGLTAVYELLRADCRPVVHEAETDPAGPGGRCLGGRMFSLRLAGADSAVDELGCRRFPDSAALLHHYARRFGLRRQPCRDNSPPDSTPPTVLDIDGIRRPARRITDVCPLDEEFRQARTRWPDAPEGISTLAEGFWTHRATGPTGRTTSLEQCDRGTLRPAVTAVEAERDPARGVVVHSDDGARERFAAVVFTPRLHLPETNVELRCRGTTASPFGPRLWRAVRRLSCRQASRTALVTERPFCKGTSLDGVALAYRLPRNPYTVDYGAPRAAGGRTAVLDLSSAWGIDAMKGAASSLDERVRLSVRGMCLSCPPGEHPCRRGLFSHFMKDFNGQPAVPGEPPHALSLAGDDTSWSPGRLDHAPATGLDTARGVLHHLGGACDPDTPGPADVWRRCETGNRNRPTTVPRERHE
ncbi:FAD-dependent oxidoreductase [Streptomyces sp. NPDC026294]|uniref:FAD-dependent oxidoreductase n=1 Tax=Streptomyces sp. NPDC026294 TaxID=3155362 RepID=UPI00340F0AC9